MTLDRVPFLFVVILTLWGGVCSAVLLILRFLHIVKVSSCNWYFARLLSWMLRHLVGLKVVLEDPHGYLQIPGPRMVVGNHQSNWDAFLFGTIFPERTYIVGKKELFWIPFFGWFFKFADNFYIDRANRKKALLCMDRVVLRIREKGDSVWMFPEGTRNSKNPGDLLPFKQGAFRTAIAAGVPVQPLVAEAYWKKKVIRIRALEPILAQKLGLTDPHALSDYVRERMLEALRSF